MLTQHYLGLDLLRKIIINSLKLEIMKVLLSICLLLCLALTVNSVRIRTQIKSQSATSQWQTFVDQQLIGSGMSGAVIISAADGGVWASKNLNLKAGEGQKIVMLFRNPNDAVTQGIIVNGQKSYALKADTSSMYGKLGIGGVILVKTKMTIIIATYNEKLQPGPAALAVEKLGDYLRSQGF